MLFPHTWTRSKWHVEAKQELALLDATFLPLKCDATGHVSLFLPLLIAGDLAAPVNFTAPAYPPSNTPCPLFHLTMVHPPKLFTLSLAAVVDLATGCNRDHVAIAAMPTSPWPVVSGCPCFHPSSIHDSLYYSEPILLRLRWNSTLVAGPCCCCRSHRR